MAIPSSRALKVAERSSCYPDRLFRQHSLQLRSLQKPQLNGCCNDASTAAGTGVRAAEVRLEVPSLSEEPAISQPTDLPSTQWASSHQNNRSLSQLPFPLNVQINARIQYT